MKTNFKTKLLLGAAVTALSFGAAAEASAADITLAVPGAFASAGGATGADIANAAAGDNVDLNSFDLTITDSAASDDGGADATYAVGAITDTGTPQDGNVLITTTTGQSAPTVTIGSINTGGNLTALTVDSDNLAITATVTGTTTLGGNLVVDNAEDNNAVANSLTLTGNANVTGTTDVTGGALAGGGSTSILNVDGASNTFTGAVTVTGGAANAGNTATLALSGASTTFTGGLTLTDGAAGTAILNVDGTTAQTVTGVIAGDGTINVSNVGGTVTFAGDSTHTGTLNINGDDTEDQAVVFSGDNASAIVLGENTGTETITATFSGTDQVISGGITSGVGETTNVVVSGTVDQTTAAWTADSVVISGSLEMNQNITAEAISGSGTLNVDTNSSFIGQGTSTNLTVSNVTVADGVTLTVDAESNTADGTISSAILLEDDGTDNGGGGALTLDNGGQTLDVSGNITTAFDSEGGITIATGDAATTNITGNVGTSSAALATLTITNAAGNSALNVGGNLYVDAIQTGTADELTFTGTNQVVSGTITGVATSDIILGNGTTQTPTVTFNGAIGTIADITVNTGSTARFNANTTITGVYAANGTTYVGEGATLDVNTTTGTGGFVLDASDADGTLTTADIGVLDFSGSEGALARSEVTVNVVGALGTGTVDVLADGGDAFADAGTLVDNSFQYSFTAATNGVLTVARRTLEDIATGNSVTSGVASTLDGLVGDTNAEIVIVNNNLAAASTQEEVNDVLASVTPSVDAGAVVGATSFVTQTSNVTNTQLASLRNGTEASGMYAGNVTNGLRGWVQGFGLTGDQDDRDGVSGYDVDSYGVAVGLDTQSLVDNWIWGLAFAYSDTDVDSDGVNNTNTDIDSYQVSVYSSYDLDDRTYISGQAGYVWGDNDQTRYNVGGANSGITADADYDSDVIFAGLEAGRKYMVGGNTVLTPKALVNYQHYDADGYTETGAGGLNTTTDGESLDLFEIGVGVDASWDYQQADGSYLQPKIGVGVRHDLIGDEYQTTSTFAAGGSSFETEGFDPAQTTFNVSADLTYFSTTNWELSAGYDFEYKSDYDSHAGTLKAAYKF